MEKLSREEVVTLCLLIYFRGMWPEEEISMRMGTTQLLGVITQVLETSGVSNAEVVALCLGTSGHDDDACQKVALCYALLLFLITQLDEHNFLFCSIYLAQQLQSRHSWKELNKYWK